MKPTAGGGAGRDHQALFCCLWLGSGSVWHLAHHSHLGSSCLAPISVPVPPRGSRHPPGSEPHLTSIFLIHSPMPCPMAKGEDFQNPWYMARYRKVPEDQQRILSWKPFVPWWLRAQILEPSYLCSDLGYPPYQLCDPMQIT